MPGSGHDGADAAEQRDTLEADGWSQSENGRDGRKEVHEPDRAAHHRAGVGATRKLHQERHSDGFAIEENSVLLFAVIAEPLAVVGQNEDERTFGNARRQRGEELADDGVRMRHLRVVRIRVAAPKRLRGLARRVRLHQVKEREEGAAAALADPASE